MHDFFFGLPHSLCDGAIEKPIFLSPGGGSGAYVSTLTPPVPHPRGHRLNWGCTAKIFKTVLGDATKLFVILWRKYNVAI